MIIQTGRNLYYMLFASQVELINDALLFRAVLVSCSRPVILHCLPILVIFSLVVIMNSGHFTHVNYLLKNGYIL